MASKQAFVGRYRDNAERLLDALEEDASLRSEWDSLGLSGALSNADVAGGDVTAAEVTAAVGSVSAVRAFMAAGHLTNLYRLRRA